VYVTCYEDKNSNIAGRTILRGSNRMENFIIDYDTKLIDYGLYLIDPSTETETEIVKFEDLTKEQIFQDEKFAERTKKIINACKSETKLRELTKELYEEGRDIVFPNIKQ
ncbi:MAG: hypothetical protein Q8O84_04375, partial [Nanoarchaeota archaeon]|nr:hypothetical protein [Nanoarchaeota archaeon]